MTTTNSAHEAETVRVPESLRWAVMKQVEMVDAGWEPCGYTGGSAGDKRQFVRVEFRRRPGVSPRPHVPGEVVLPATWECEGGGDDFDSWLSIGKKVSDA